jgi:flagellar biosynthesis protein
MQERPPYEYRESDGRLRPQASQTQAVAIEYARGVDDAPRVTASGKGAIADQILAIAFDRGIKVREDAELVEMLSLVEVDSPIPLEAFTAVAEILAVVYQANALKKPRSPAWKET